MRRHHEREEVVFTGAVQKAASRGQALPVKEERRVLWCCWLPPALSATDTLTLKHSVSFSFSFILPLIRSSQPSLLLLSLSSFLVLHGPGCVFVCVCVPSRLGDMSGR